MSVLGRDNRASAIGLGLPFARVLPAPDGLIGRGDRRQLALCYRGLSMPEGRIISLRWSNAAVTQALKWAYAAIRCRWSNAGVSQSAKWSDD